MDPAQAPPPLPVKTLLAGAGLGPSGVPIPSQPPQLSASPGAAAGLAAAAAASSTSHRPFHQPHNLSQHRGAAPTVTSNNGISNSSNKNYRGNIPNAQVAFDTAHLNGSAGRITVPVAATSPAYPPGLVAPPLPPKMSSATASPAAAAAVAAFVGLSSNYSANVAGPSPAASVGAAVVGSAAGNPSSLLGVVPPAPLDPFVPVARSAAGTPLPAVSTPGAPAPSSATVNAAMAAYTHAWNCTTGPPGASTTGAPLKNGHFGPPQPAPVYTLGHFQLSGGGLTATLPQKLTPRVVGVPPPALPKKKTTSDLIDLDLDSLLRTEGDVLDLFDPLKVNSGQNTPGLQSNHSDRPATADGAASKQSTTGFSRPLPKERPVPAERESLRKKDNNNNSSSSSSGGSTPTINNNNNTGEPPQSDGQGASGVAGATATSTTSTTTNTATAAAAVFRVTPPLPLLIGGPTSESPTSASEITEDSTGGVLTTTTATSGATTVLAPAADTTIATTTTTGVAAAGATTETTEIQTPTTTASAETITTLEGAKVAVISRNENGGGTSPYEVHVKDRDPNRTSPSSGDDPITTTTTSTSSSSPGSISDVLAKRSEERLRFLEAFRVEERQRAANPDVEAFWTKCKQLRSVFTYDDHLTNAGLIVSPTLDTQWQEPMSVRMEISTPACDAPFCFNCDVTTTIQHVISQVVCSAALDDTNMDNYVLRVRGRAEYLTADSMVREYEYAHWCVKFDRPLCLTLLKVEDLRRPWQRVLRDDAYFLDVKSCDLLPADTNNIEIHEIQVYLDTFRYEALRLLKQNGTVIRTCGVTQAVKAVCARLSRVETPDLVQALEGLERLCEGEAPDFIEMERRREVVCYQLFQIQRNLQQLLQMYSETFPVNFVIVNDRPSTPSPSPDKRPRKEVTHYSDSVLFFAGSLYQPRPEWLVNHERFAIRCQLVYGWRIIHQVESVNGRIGGGLFPKIDFDDWLELEIPMRLLPRESALYVKVFGVSKEDPSQRIPLGWFALNMFSSKRELIQGTKLCPLWGPDVDEMSGPPCCSDCPSAPLMLMQFTEFDNIVFFPKVCHEKAPKVEADLDPSEVLRLREMLDCDPLCSLPTTDDDKKFFWDRRLFVRKLPQLLPKVLLSRDAWSWAYLKDIYAILREWVPASDISALTLLLPQFPDSEVRRVAVGWIKHVGSDELCDHLPQLVQALRFEVWEDSPVTWFLLERALMSTRVAHQMYWLLRQNEANLLSRRRVRMMISALRIISGEAFSCLITAQDRLLQGLRASAEALKRARESDRIATLLSSLQTVNDCVDGGGPLCLPLNPCLEVAAIEVKHCTYFTSNTLPLKLTFKNTEPMAESHEVIFKVGDDLRQDMLVLQMIRIMDKLWLKQGLDLRIITFECVATGKNEGMVEVVREAETLRKIQTEHGLTGSFKDKPIAEWLKKHNASEAEYKRAVENFSLSCAGYCVATYVLGICDRHNDNIMLRPSGHMFHIDFGKFLGDAQMFGNIKRDRVPFVLTSDMVYVINGGDKDSRQFQKFVEKCCQAFNILRESSNVLITLFGLMVSSGIPGLNEEAVQFVQKALMLGKTPAEASVAFTKLVKEAMSSMSTQVNFFIHNIAQMRSTCDHNDVITLNFAPKVHTKKTDGRLLYYQIIDCQKKYIPEKHYVYVIQLRREKELTDMRVHRTYDEFREFHYKLNKLFPNATFPQLTKSSLIGRTNTADVAEKRKGELVSFLRELQNMAEEVAHCDLVYTFFHPLFRDQERLDDIEQHFTNDLQLAGPSGHYETSCAGRIKLDLTFANRLLSIMVMCAENLRSERKGAPDAYVKTYLKPDPDKLTKRKTRVISRCRNPSFMELVSYRYPYETLRTCVLEVSVWDHDRVQGNEILGSAYIILDKLDLSKPHIAWFNLSAVGRGFAS